MPPGVLMAAPTREEATARLQELVDLWRLARERSLPLFQKTSYALAEETFAEPDPLAMATVRRRCAAVIDKVWRGEGKDQRAERDDPWLLATYGDVDLHDLLSPDHAGDLALLPLARRLWSPVLDAIAKGEGIAPRWAPISQAAS